MVWVTLGLDRRLSLQALRPVAGIARKFRQILLRHYRLIYRVVERRVVILTCRDHHQSEPDNVGKGVRDMIRRTGIIDAGSHTISYTKALLNLAQQQNTAVRGEQTAIETGIYPLARNG